EELVVVVVVLGVGAGDTCLLLELVQRRVRLRRVVDVDVLGPVRPDDGLVDVRAVLLGCLVGGCGLAARALGAAGGDHGRHSGRPGGGQERAAAQQAARVGDRGDVDGGAWAHLVVLPGAHPRARYVSCAKTVRCQGLRAVPVRSVIT